MRRLKTHRISDTTLQLACQHAQQLYRHGKTLEQQGASLETEIGYSPEQCKYVKAAGQQIQYHAQTMYALIEAARRDKDCSTELYVRASKEHIEAIELHMKAHSVLNPASVEQTPAVSHPKHLK